MRYAQQRPGHVFQFSSFCTIDECSRIPRPTEPVAGINHCPTMQNLLQSQTVFDQQEIRNLTSGGTLPGQ